LEYTNINVPDGTVVETLEEARDGLGNGRLEVLDELVSVLVEELVDSPQWGKLGGHIDIVVLSILLSNICSPEPLLVFINQL